MRRDIGQEILDGVEEIKTGGGVRMRWNCQMMQRRSAIRPA